MTNSGNDVHAAPIASAGEMRDSTIVVTSALPARPREIEVDPVTTEIIRAAMNSAANQMKRALCRTAYSPLIYEVLDFAGGLYDNHYRLLAQAPSLPHFMGTLSFCIEEAVKDAGGPEKLNQGDILIYNWPYGTGSHAQDVALIIPIFHEGELYAYGAIKAHWLDIGATYPYCTSTTDVYQEGTFMRGIKLFKQGVLDEEIYRILIDNSRLPKALRGDMFGQATGLRAGEKALGDVVTRFGMTTFRSAVEQIFDHGEAMVRSFYEKIPDGRYSATGRLDNDGINDDVIPFEVLVEINGSSVRVDYSNAPPITEGPYNCPLPETVSATRVALAMLAGGGEATTEGHFRALDVATRRGTIFHPEPPAPCFMYGWPGLQAMDVIMRAIGQSDATLVPADPGSDIVGAVWWGTREGSGEPWGDGHPFPMGLGGNARGDGGVAMCFGQSAARLSPYEVWEAKSPRVVEKAEFRPDSGGPGKHRGGPGIDYTVRVLEDCHITTISERTKTPPPGLAGGGNGEPCSVVVEFPDGRRETHGKASNLALPKGSRVHFFTGGGGGWGNPAERSADSVKKDLEEGYTTAEASGRHYPHAL